MRGRTEKVTNKKNILPHFFIFVLNSDKVNSSASLGILLKTHIPTPQKRYMNSIRLTMSGVKLHLKDTCITAARTHPGACAVLAAIRTTTAAASVVRAPQMQAALIKDITRGYE